ncbi:MAG TPA: HlyD family efflux transporter periplasmic adaptor subunit [Kofleriaceae bacterium]|nr:HlyD family efflux transporter periplasmic adaptor subunit [Kofleriaceae bacterium]
MPVGSSAITVVGFGRIGAGPRVLVADGDAASRQWLRSALAGDLAIDEIDRGDLALDLIAAGKPRLVVIGAQLVDMSGSELIERAAQWFDDRHARMGVFLLTDAAGNVADVDESRVSVFYRLTPAMQPARARELMKQAASTLPPTPPQDEAVPPHVAPHVERIGAQDDPASAAQAAIGAVIALLGATRARCLYCDEDTGLLWPEGEDGEHEAKASAGLVGFAARSGACIVVPSAADDALYRADIDDPTGDGRERLAVQPVVGLDGHVHAVLIAIRTAGQPPFTDEDSATLRALATGWAPHLQQLAMRAEADNILGDRLDAGPSELFRQEAIVSLVRRGARGDVVRVHPGWIRAAYWIVLASLLGMIAFASLAKVHEYTEGPAIVRATGRNEVVAMEPGTITALEVQRGAIVKAGQPLARLHDAEQLGRLRGLETEFERKLVAYLQTPADTSVRQALAQIVSQRESARAGVEAKMIRAPRDGIVKEVLVRNGQRVDAGATVMSIIEQGATEGLSLYAFVPGSQRPRLRVNQRLDLTLPGYRGARITTRVLAVSSEVLGADDARMRYLGERVSASLPVQGTVVVVEAQLASPTFEADGEHYQLHDGMIGTAEIRLASRSVLETMIPGLSQ